MALNNEGPGSGLLIVALTAMGVFLLLRSKRAISGPMVATAGGRALGFAPASVLLPLCSDANSSLIAQQQAALGGTPTCRPRYCGPQNGPLDFVSGRCLPRP